MKQLHEHERALLVDLEAAKNAGADQKNIEVAIKALYVVMLYAKSAITHELL